MRLTQRLLPFLQAALLKLSEIISVLNLGQESQTFFRLNDLDLKENCSLRNSTCQAITTTGFFFRELARKNYIIPFVHAYPGR